MRKKISSRPPSAAARPVSERPEVKYYGLHACLAVWRERPHDVIRIYLTEERIAPCAPMLKWAAQQRKAYHVVTAEDLERLTESVHHQGICMLALERPALGLPELVAETRRRRAVDRLVYLDGVENPHNLGAIVRSCAHFGFRYLLGEAGRLPRFSPSACRVAEGGTEFVHPVHLQDPGCDISALREAGFALVGTSVREGTPLYRYRFPPRVMLVLGGETSGMSQELHKNADEVLSIPGTGAVESLNVSVAFALLAGELYRQRLFQRGGEDDHGGRRKAPARSRDRRK